MISFGYPRVHGFDLTFRWSLGNKRPKQHPSKYNQREKKKKKRKKRRVNHTRTTYRINESDDSNMNICETFGRFRHCAWFPCHKCVFVLSIGFRIKRILRSLHKTTAPRWYECAKILADQPSHTRTQTHTHHTVQLLLHIQFCSVSLALARVRALFYELGSSSSPFFYTHPHFIGVVQLFCQMCSSVWPHFFFIFDFLSSFVDVYLKMCQWKRYHI